MNVETMVLRDRVIRELSDEIESLKTKIKLVQRACNLILSIQKYEDEPMSDKNKTPHSQVVGKPGV